MEGVEGGEGREGQQRHTVSVGYYKVACKYMHTAHLIWYKWSSDIGMVLELLTISHYMMSLLECEGMEGNAASYLSQLKEENQKPCNIYSSTHTS